MSALERGVRIRIRIIGGLFALAFVLIVWRAFDLQVLHGEEWRGRAERQHQKTVPMTPQRGTIFDRNGAELAVSIEVDSIYAEPVRIDDPAGAATRLAKTLGLTAKELRKKLSGDKSFVWLKRQVTPKESEQVRQLTLAGVGVVREHQRFYPNAGLAGHLLGFTGVDPKGLEGLELAYDKQILGRGGYLVMGRDAFGRGLGSSTPQIQGASRGHDLYLTVDKNLQHIVERELLAGLRAAKAKAATALMIEPATGKVLAMASYPEFNPNSISEYRPAQWRNRAICDSYEPGSTFKVVLMAAALNEGLVGPGQHFDCENGSFRVGGRTIRDHKKFADLTTTEIIKYSSNIGSAKIGKLLERETFYKYIRDFGFGGHTGIDLPGEVSGILSAPNRWFEIDLAAISFGQGISVTPLQLATAVSAIANGGYLMEPFVVDRVVDSQGALVRQVQPKVVRRVISRDVARTVTQMMVTTTEEGGTAIRARVPGYRVAGKTGTAQKVDAVTGGYSVDKRVASVIGFLPADDPKVTILVVLDEPSNGVYGGVLAAPVFARIAAQTMQYLKVAPGQSGRGDDVPPPLDRLLVSGDLGESPRIQPVEVAGSDGPVMPDFYGMTYRQVLNLMGERQLNVSFRGHGRVVEQSHRAGSAVPYNSPVWVRLAPPG
ncbi:MAG: penicillin-binding protein [Desulfuromonadales bacterium]|nr:penicillin-binding protein [Desulfuromonadales bacterium]